MKMNNIIKSIIIILVLILQFPAFAGNKSHLAKPDPFYPDRIHYFSDPIEIKENKLFTLDSGSSFFQIHHAQTSSNIVWYLTTEYFSEHWLFIQKIRFLIDGKIYDFQSEPYPKHEISNLGGVWVEETNLFIITDELINAIKNANSIRIRLEGNNYYQERVLSENDLKYMKWFLNDMNIVESEAKEKRNITSVNSSIDTSKTALAQTDLNGNSKVVFGVSFVDLPSAAALAINRENLKAVLVLVVTPSSISDKAGVKVGDVIYEFDGKKIEKNLDLQKAVTETDIGKKVTVKLIRQGGELNLEAQF